MDSFRQTLQSNGKLFSNFEFVFDLSTENRKIFNKKQGWVYASEVGEAFVLTRSSCCDFIYLFFLP